MTAFATIDHLRSQLGAKGPTHSPEYIAKMMHDIPEAKSVDRAAFLLSHVTGRRVLEFGASGPMHERIRQSAAVYVGVDRQASTTAIGFDLDDVCQQALEPLNYSCEVIVCGEVLEHLGNPQWFLTRLKRQFPCVPVLITVPNAFSRVARAHALNGTENVNRDHVSWYSYRTLRTLLERVGYGIAEFAWYGGDGPTAQGLIVVTE